MSLNNPFIEASFSTVKRDPEYPGRFRDQVCDAGSGASRAHGSDCCSTTGTAAGAVPAAKGGEP